VQIAATESDLRPHVAAWTELAEAEGVPYCLPEWMLAAWRNIPPERADLRVLVALDGERAVGIAPLFAETATRGLTRYRLLGADASPRGQPLAAEGRGEAVAEAFAATLAEARPRASVIRFEGIPAGSPWPGLIAGRWPGRARCVRDESVASPRIGLTGRTYDDWFAARSAQFRMRSRQSRRKLDARAATFRLASAETLAGDVDAFVTLHRARWEGRGGSGVLTAPVERMVREAAPRLLAGGHLRLAVIEVEGQVISAQVFLAAGGEVTWWLGGFDDAWKAYQPSHQALLYAIANAFEQGDGGFDLGSGGQRYKYSFADGEDRLVWVHLLPPGPGALVRRAQLSLRRVRRRASADPSRSRA
jgi:CelD/BcsL family acetyltransferase involved in cellulose biosynthesis